MLAFLKTLILGFFGLFLKHKEDTSEALGRAEEKALYTEDNVVALKRETADARDVHNEVMAEPDTQLNGDMSKYVRDPGK